MSRPAIRVENLGKQYRLGLTHARSLNEAAGRLTRRLRGMPPVEAQVNAVEPDRPATRGEFWALKDVSFEVQPGEVVGIIGRNGAGKSTLLKILSRVTRPTTGRVTMRGRVGSLLEVGTGFHPELTGRENVYLNGTILGLTKHEITRKLDAIVDFAGVDRFLDTPVKRYSSGMTVRLGFAVAAHLEPEILIVDEVLAVGDVAFQRRCLGKIEDIAGSGRTVLIVSHNMDAIARYCRRAILLTQGVLQGEDNPAKSIYAYLNTAAITEPNGTDACTSASASQDRYISKLPDIILGVSLHGVTGEQGLVHVGTSARVTIALHVPPEHVPANCGIIIVSRNGWNISAHRSGQNGDLVNSHGYHTITCDLAAVPLVPGEYSLSVSLEGPRGVFARAASGASFAVVDYGMHDEWMPTQEQGSTLIPSVWTCEL